MSWQWVVVILGIVWAIVVIMFIAAWISKNNRGQI